MKQLKLLAITIALAFVLVACGNTANGTYIYNGNLPLITNAKVTLTIKGEEGTMRLKGNSLGLFSSESESEVVVNQKSKTIEVDGATLKYTKEDGDLVIVEDSSGIFTDAVFKKKK